MSLARGGRARFGQGRYGRKSMVLAAAVSAGLAQVAWADNGTWTNLSGGNWNLAETGNWLNGIVADGADFTADFNTLNITGDRTVSLTEARTIGHLIFGDTNNTHTWTLSSSAPADALTLSVAAGAPTITVNNVGGGKTVTINSNLAGSSGLTKLGTGTLTLAGTNGYTGVTTIDAGTLIAAHTGALPGYNTAGQVIVNAGTVGAIAGGSGFSATDIDTLLASATFNAGSGFALQVDSGNFTYGGNITQPGSFNKLGAGTLNLTGTSNFSGSFNVTTGIVSVDAGSITAAGTSQVNAGRSLIVNGGSATFTGTLRTENNPGAIIRVNSGNLTASNLLVQRNVNAVAPNYASGFIVAGGTADVTTAIIGSNNSTGSMSVEGGTFNGGTVTVGNQATSGRGGGLQVIGGAFNASELVLSKANGTNGNNVASATFAGGISTIDTLTMGFDDTVTAGTATVNINGGAVYVGSGGINRGAQATTTTNINLTSGTLGAKADWASNRDMNLNGAGFTAQAADAANNPFNITLAGVLSGAGTLTKTGGGTLTLTGSNTYTSNITVSAGALRGHSGSLLNTIDNAGQVILDQPSNGTFGGSIIGAGSVQKTGAGTLTLNAQAYTGATTVSGGTLRLGGSHASSGVTVQSGAALGLASGGATINALTLGSAGADAMTLSANSGAGLETLNVTSSGGLITNGTTTIDIGIAGITVGQHTLVDYAGAIGGSGFAGFTLGTLPSRVQASLVNNTTAGSVDLNVTLVDFPRWEGNLSDDWDINTTANWKEATSGNSTNYLQNTIPGDQVLFTDDATGTTTVDITTTVQPTFITVNNDQDPYTFTGTGKISGPGGLTKQGPGTLTISNSGGNDYSGVTTISQGSIILGGSNVLSDNSPINVSGGTLDLGANSDTAGAVTLTSGTIASTGGQLTAPSYELRSGTVNAALFGSGGLTKTSAGTVMLNAAAGYTGTTSIQEGTLQLGVANAIPIASAVVLGTGSSSGTLELSGNTLFIDSLATSGTGTANSVVNSSGTAAQLFVGGTTSSTYAGSLDGNLSLIFSSPSPQTLTLTGTSTYTGGTTIDFGGAIAIASDAALGAVPASPTVNLTFMGLGGTLAAAATDVTLHANRIIETSGLAITFDAGTDANTMTINGNIQGGGFVTKTGNGTTILNGIGSFSSTTINAGELRAGNNNAIGTGSVTIAAGSGNGQLQLANGVTLTNELISNSTSSNNMVNVPEDGATATFAGNVSAGVAGAQYRPGTTGVGATLVLTGNATISNTVVVAQGNVVVAQSGVLSAGQGLLGRATAPGMSLTAKDNASVSFGSNVVLGDANNIPDLDLTVQDSASISVGTTLNLLNVNATPVTAHSDVNLNGGTLTVGSFIKSANAAGRTAAINFNGGTLRPNGSTADFLPALAGTVGNVGNGGAIIDTNSFDVTVATPLQPAGTGGLTKNGLGTLTMSGVHGWNGATTVNAGVLQLAPGAASLIKGGNVSVAAGTKIDLTDNKLITTSPAGTFVGGAYDGVSGLVDSARGSAGNAMWDGATGITTSDSRAINNGDLVSIGVAKVSDVRTVADTATTTFAGQTVLGSDTLVMATWGGDANLDGKINIDDYGRIDGNVGQSGSVFGWSKGDFNYDGKINIDDYGIIDGNINRQGAAFATAGIAASAALDGVSAVPEPGSLSLLALGAASLMRRRRRLAR